MDSAEKFAIEYRVVAEVEAGEELGIWHREVGDVEAEEERGIWHHPGMRHFDLFYYFNLDNRETRLLTSI